MGMSLTSEGKNLLEDLEGFMRELKGIDVMELELKHTPWIQKVMIVPGDSDESPMVKDELGKAMCGVHEKASQRKKYHRCNWRFNHGRCRGKTYTRA